MDQRRVVDFLLDAKNYSYFGINGHGKVKHIETHISHVFLVDGFAFKLKKAVRFPFLDFSTLKKRKKFCFKEFRYNSRISPELYIGVFPIRIKNKRLNFSTGRVVDYLLQMKRLATNSRMDLLLEENKIKKEHIVSLAKKVAFFHLKAKRITAKKYSNVYLLLDAIDNIKIVFDVRALQSYAKDIEKLIELSHNFFERKKQLLSYRFKNKIRHCHGDLHSANIFFIKDKPIIFDCIEFNNNFAYIDTASDVAFLTMDLKARKRERFARVFIENYNRIVKDSSLFEVLPLYESYRANVRAKVAALRISQLEKNSQKIPKKLISEFENYLQLATKLLK